MKEFVVQKASGSSEREKFSPHIMDSQVPDWNQLLPDLLFKIAAYGVTNEMQAASKTWKGILESGTTKLAICESELPLDLALRFHSLTSLDLRECTSVTPERLQALEAMLLTRLAIKIEPDAEGVPAVDLSRSLAEALRGLSLAQLDLHLGGHLASTKCYVIDWLQCFSGLPVVSLELENMELIPIFLAPFAAMPGLVNLTISGENSLNQFVNDNRDFVLPLLRGKSLTALNLEDFLLNYHHDASLDVFKGMPLASLTLQGCSLLTDTGYAHLRGLPLTFLDLEFVCLLTDSGFENMLSGMPLTELTLAEMKIFTGSGLGVLRGMPLTKLNLSGSDLSGDVEGGGRLPSLRGLPLTDLNVTWSNITDVGLECLRGLPLTRANISSCREVTGSGFAALKDAPSCQLELYGPDPLFGVAAKVLGRTDGLVRSEGLELQRIVGSNEEGFIWANVNE